MINTAINPPKASGFYLTYPWPQADEDSARVLYYCVADRTWRRNQVDRGLTYPVAIWEEVPDVLGLEAPMETFEFHLLGTTLEVTATSRLNAALKIEAAMNELLDSEGID